MAFFQHPFQIIKATPIERTGAIDILVRASSEKEDKKGESILLSAYSDPEMRKDFHRSGYLDYNHLTNVIDKYIIKNKDSLSPVDLVSLQEAKVKAIIGGIESSGFKSDFPSEYNIKDDGFYIKSRVFPENNFVKEIRKGLEAGWWGWGASVLGYANKTDVQGNKVKKIRLRSCALAPVDEVMNEDTGVVLLKGQAVFLRDLEKSFSDEEPETETSVIKSSQANDDLKAEMLLLKSQIATFSKILNADEAAKDRIAHQIYTDINSRITLGSMANRSSEVREFLKSNYGFEGENLEDTADAIYLLLNGNTHV